MRAGDGASWMRQRFYGAAIVQTVWSRLIAVAAFIDPADNPEARLVARALPRAEETGQFITSNGGACRKPSDSWQGWSTFSVASASARVRPSVTTATGLPARAAASTKR
jgi:hypothetical protein